MRRPEEKERRHKQHTTEADEHEKAKEDQASQQQGKVRGEFNRDKQYSPEERRRDSEQ